MIPAPSPARSALGSTVLSTTRAENAIREEVRRIHHDALEHSRYLREPDFTAIHPRDLEFLFGAYDQRFFGSLCRQALAGRRLRFRLSPRMTRAGGKTTRFTTRAGEVSFEIAIASSILFDGFSKTDRSVTVCGLECGSRLEALQRIFEHEMVHLIEQLCWETSDCTAARFQGIAGRYFLHRAHTHNLVTRRERAAELGIRVGSQVRFMFEGRQMSGLVNRVTKRATVLVEDAGGKNYSDGRRYKVYYVPLAMLRAVGGDAGTPGALT
jgi:hypothetical protein